MKKYFICLFILSISFVFNSCEKDEGLDPRPLIVSGQFVRLDIDKRVLNIDDISNTAFGGIVTSPGGNVVKYELFIRRKTNSGVITGDYVKFPVEITSFPFDLRISIQQIATAFNINVSDIKKGENFNFLGFSYDKDGNKVDYLNLSSVVKVQPGSKQAYKFVTTIVDNGTFKNSSKDYDNYNLN